MKRMLIGLFSLMLVFGVTAASGAEPEIAVEDEASARMLIEKLQTAYSAEVIMGTPLEVNDMKIIPLATVGIGYGGHEMPSDEQRMSGTGGVLTPAGIIVVSGKHVQLIQFSKGIIEQIVGALASVALPVVMNSDLKGNGEHTSYKIDTVQRYSGIVGNLMSIYWRMTGYIVLGGVALGLLTVSFFSQHVSTVTSVMTQNAILAGVTGLIGCGAVILLAAVFLISLLGIPFALLLIILAGIGMVFGAISLALIVGQKATAIFKWGNVSERMYVLIGGCVLGIIGLIPFAGWCFWMLLGLFGFGAVLQILWENVRPQHL